MHRSVADSLARILAAAVLLLCFAGTVRAHFPWLATDSDGRAILFFGESPADRTYHTPQAVAEAKVLHVAADGATSDVALQAVEEDDFIGRRAGDDAPAEGLLATEIVYGNYNGMLLTYHAQHILGNELDKAPASELKLDAAVRREGDKLVVALTWDGKPLADAEVTLNAESGDPVTQNADKEGIVRFDAPVSGLVGLLFSRTDGSAKGEANGHAYSSTADYGTLTFHWTGKDSEDKPAEESDDSEESEANAVANNAGLPPLTEAVASFGAAVCDGWLYVYSGHTGEEHAHSRDNLSQNFRRVRLGGGASAWDELPMQSHLQGLPLVAYKGKLYRVGGLSARNAAGEDADMHSVDEFASFDPKTQEWTALPPLPQPRSSHDAAVIDDTLYVVGGWKLAGDSDGEWQPAALAFDLTKPESGWREIAKPDFLRRALAVAPWNGKLAVLGGMDENREISRRVDQFDPVTNEWSELPSLPGDGMDGFGVSAWGVGGNLYASSADGVVYELSPGVKEWTKAGELVQPRFFHRVVPDGAGGLLAIGGASMDAGHVTSIERVTLDKPGK